MKELRCHKCEKVTNHWADGVCSICRPEPPSTEVVNSILISKMSSILGHLKFYTIMYILGLVIWILTAMRF